jgi:hypothetical protein
MMKLPEQLALRPREAARMLSISERTLWSLTAPRGPIPCVRLTRGVLYSVDDLRQWLREQSTGNVQKGGEA